MQGKDREFHLGLNVATLVTNDAISDFSASPLSLQWLLTFRGFWLQVKIICE